MALTFGPLIIGIDGIVSIRRSPDKVIYIRWGDDWPLEPPTGENWLVPRDGKTIRFLYHPGLNFILFHICLPGKEKSHAKTVSRLANWFQLSLPHYGEWVRANSKPRYLIKTDEICLATEFRRSRDTRARFRNLRDTIMRLNELEAVPCDYTIRITLESGNVHRTLVRDWCKCREN